MRTCEWQNPGSMDRCGQKDAVYYDKNLKQLLCTDHARVAGFGCGHFCEPYLSLGVEEEAADEQ